MTPTSCGTILGLNILFWGCIFVLGLALWGWVGALAFVGVIAILAAALLFIWAAYDIARREDPWDG